MILAPHSYGVSQDSPAPVVPAKRKRGRPSKTTVVVDPAVAPATPTATPVKRGRGRPRGSRNRKSTGRGGAPAALTRAAEAPAEPVPIEGVNRGRRPGPVFNFALPVPPIDVDGFQRVLTHDVLVSKFYFLLSLELIFLLRSAL